MDSINMDTIVGRVLENCTIFLLDIKGDYEGSQPYFQKIKYLVVTCDNGVFLNLKMLNNHLENCQFLGGFFMKLGYLMQEIKYFTYWIALVWFIKYMVDVLY
jgi:hypothetical protein